MNLKKQVKETIQKQIKKIETIIAKTAMKKMNTSKDVTTNRKVVEIVDHQEYQDITTKMIEDAYK